MAASSDMAYRSPAAVASGLMSGWNTVAFGVAKSDRFELTSLDFHGAEFANADQRVVSLQLVETNHQWLVAEPRHRGRFVSES